MRTYLVFTLIGPDQIGIVDRVTKKILEFNGNIEESRMARLGGDFAMIVFLSVSESNEAQLMKGLESLENEEFQIFIRKTRKLESVKYRGWMPFHVVVNGADHEGIINSITHYIKSKGINIETMNTDSIQAPMSGTLLFTMEAIVLVPPNLSVHDWKTGLFEVCENANVDVEVSPYMG